MVRGQGHEPLHEVADRSPAYTVQQFVRKKPSAADDGVTGVLGMLERLTGKGDPQCLDYRDQMIAW